MHTTQEWHRNTTLNVTQAQKARIQASTQSARSHRAHDESASLNFSATENLHVSLQDKVQNSHRLVDRLWSRAASLQTSIAETRHSLGGLEVALRSKEPRLQLCVWRIAQRERRPLREQVADYVGRALEAEKSVIVHAQRQLGDAINITQVVLGGLERKLEQVSQDVDQKKTALHADELCLRTTHRSLLERTQSAGTSRRVPGTPDTISSPSARYGPKTGAHRVTDRNEEVRLQDAVRLDMSAIQQEQSAKAVRERNAKLAAAADCAVKASLSKSVAAMQERVNEAQTVRRKLEASIKETQVDIRKTRSTMTETRQEIKSLQEPIAMCATCTTARKGRPNREHIVDPVSAQLQEHKVALLRSNEALRNHHESEKAALQDLANRASQLKDDLKDKTTALRIDVMCLTHDPVYPETDNFSGGLASRASTTPRSRSDGHGGHSHRHLRRPSSCGAGSRMSIPMPMTVR